MDTNYDNNHQILSLFLYCTYVARYIAAVGLEEFMTVYSAGYTLICVKVLLYTLFCCMRW